MKALGSVITAFIIGLASSVTAAIVEAKGNLPGAATWIVAIMGALAVGAKDYRSLMKLPPMNGNGSTPLAVWLLPFLLIGLLTSGCKSTETAYKVTGVTAATVDRAVDVWCDYVVWAEKNETERQEEIQKQHSKVTAAYERYQSAMDVVSDAGAALAESGDKSKLEAAFAVAQLSGENLLELILHLIPPKWGNTVSPSN